MVASERVIKGHLYSIKTKKGLSDLSYPCVRDIFTLLLIKQIFEKNPQWQNSKVGHSFGLKLLLLVDTFFIYNFIDPGYNII